MQERCFRCLPFCVLGVLWLGPAAASGQEQLGDDPAPPEAPEVIRRDASGRATIRATRISTPLQVDGDLTEEVYQSVRSIGDLIQQDPSPGDLTTEPTEFWIFFDDQNFYVAARLYDSHPERIVANEMRRDNTNIVNNQNFTVVLDTFHDRRSGFLFQTNPLGALRDALITDEGSPNTDWNTIWDVKTSRSDEGWTLEMVIPFKSLRYSAGREQVWGINIRRSIRWKNEYAYVTPVPPSFGGPAVYRVSFGATLVGVQAPVASRSFEVKPYVISSLHTNRAATPAVENDLLGDVGLDVKYGLSRGLTADFTYNTDFAQVEEDNQQVNLTRFSLFFPEKREFFLEGQGIFSFGGVGSGRRGGGGGGGGLRAANLTPVMFFSRRVGLSGGRSVPIVAGGRVTGRAGQYTLGLLNIETADDDALGVTATNFSVVRVRRDILRRSTIGFIGTNRMERAGGAEASQAFGVDANFAFHESIQARAFYAQTSTSSEQTGSATSYLGEIVYNADRYGFVYQHQAVGKAFNPTMGFLRRTDVRQNFVGVRFSPRPRSSEVVRKLFFSTSLDYITTFDYRLETREAQASFGFDFHNSDKWRVQYTDSFEFLAEPFEIARDITLRVGPYSFRQVSTRYTMGPQRRVAGNVSVGVGSFYNGTRAQVGYGGRVELASQLLAEPSVSFNVIDLPNGRFTTTLVSTRMTLTISPRSFFSALVQYNSSNQALSANLRFRWEYQPGSDLFVAYSEGRDTGTGHFPTLENRGVVVKMTRLFRF